MSPLLTTTDDRSTIDEQGFVIDQDLLSHYLPLLHRPGYAVAVHERKGTAMLRRIFALSEDFGPEAWDRVQSTSTLQVRARQNQLDEKVLLVDDLLKTGRTIVTVVERLIKAGVPASRICVAVLGSHETFNIRQLTDLGVEVRIWRKSLSDEAYLAFRQELVAALQAMPGPFLDTEHIEVALELRSHKRTKAPSFLSLVDALARTGEVVTLPGREGGRRASIYYSTTQKHASTAALGLGGPNHDIVRKCRVVEAGPNKYRLLAICLPDLSHSVPLGMGPAQEFAARVLSSPKVAGDVRHMFRQDAGSYREQFFRNSIVASMQPLAWALQDVLVAFGTAHAQPSVPAPAVAGATSLAHLTVAYPGIELSAVESLLQAAIVWAKGRATEIPRSNTGHATHLDAATLAQLTSGLEQLVSMRVDEQIFEKEMGLSQTAEEVGVEHATLLHFGARLGISAPIVSAVLDEVLDLARFSTKVQTLTDGRTVRTYKPDGEVTAQLLRGERRSGGFRG